MDELLKQVEAQTGIPADMLERAAQARAGAEGTTAEAIVAGWAGAPLPEAGTSAPPLQAEPVVAAAEAVEAASEVSVEVIEPEASLPDETPDEAVEELEPVAVDPGMPRWLSAAFVVVPFVAILYALLVPNGPDCGNAGRLAVDPVTGTAVNCDGSVYGVAGVDFFSIGATVYEASCAACHGDSGGGGVGPGLAGGAVVATFSSCADHIELVRVGSAGWPGATYGDSNKPKLGNMPPWGSSLSAEELAAVVVYERVAFGSEALGAAEQGCGLSAAEVSALGR